MQRHLNISISTPYQVINDKATAKNIWLCLHGQGQLAEYFIKNFETLPVDENFILTPQGLSKYYLNGFTGRVGASWMTKEDRLTEIENQQLLLKGIWETEVGEVEDKRVVFFGFSQGVATITRFIAYSKVPFDKLVLWAGGFAHDVKKSDFDHLTGSEEIEVFVSDEDPFYDQIKISEQIELIELVTGIKPQLTNYKGGHRIDRDLLKSI